MRSSRRFFDNDCLQAAILQLQRKVKGREQQDHAHQLLVYTWHALFVKKGGKSVAMSYSDEEAAGSDVEEEEEETEEEKAVKEMVNACKYG